ncbi:MAG: TerB family tellurite resistance protein [Deltaproteobacteria bacterium]|nr:TerB family tellurite resistance protein [Deltaproteobacteria bacterium]
MRDEDLFLSVVRLWAATAWADGVLADAERRLLEGLIVGAEVSDPTRTAALSFLENKVELDRNDIDRLSPKERQSLYRTACRMTTVDRHFDNAERAFLTRLGSQLELDAESVATIERDFLRPV